MLPRKTGKPIAFKCTEELRKQTEAIADRLSMSLSDYVRKAVEAFNQGNSIVLTGSTHNTVSNPDTSVAIKTHNRMIAERDNTVSKPTIPELKDKPKMVQYLGKGGK
jgi:hypothetical protein